MSTSPIEGHRVLVISPHFPPVNAPDHQRVRLSLPHFRECGWDPTVLAVAADDVAAPRDDLQTATLPGGVTVHRVGAVPARLSRLLGIGNLGYRAWLPLRRAGDALLARGRFDLVYFSTTVFVATTLGRHWLRKHGVPYVVDIQDPWRTDYYDRPGAPRPPGGWKYRWARRQANRLEERAWREASGFISVSPGYLDALQSRYAWFGDRPSAVIPFGAAPADFQLARSRPDLPVAFHREPGFTHIVSVGAIGPIMAAAVDEFLRGLAAWRAADPARAATLRVHFVGTSYAPTDKGTCSILPLAEKHHVTDLVTEETNRIPFFAALKTMAEADGILLPASDDPNYSPSKIAQVFLAGRPVLAIAPEGSAARSAVAELNLTPFVAAPGEREAASRIAAFFDGVTRKDSACLGARNETAFARTYSALATTRQQCALFERALAWARLHRQGRDAKTDETARR